MSNKPLNIGEEARVQMPMKTVASLIVLVAMGVFAYTELTATSTISEATVFIGICTRASSPILSGLLDIRSST
jgi:hypothetical protein